MASITVDLVFLTEGEGGRKSPLYLDSDDYHYRPHIVIGDRNQREAIFRERFIDEVYLGVQFRPCGRVLQPGDEATLILNFMNYPDREYDKAVPGAGFTVREGAQIVAHGVIIKRTIDEIAC